MKFRNTKLTSLILGLMLVLMMSLSVVGCGTSQENPVNGGSQETENAKGEKNVLGEGETVFDFTVIDKAGNETRFEIHTDKETVGAALLECKLIEGEESQFGLYVKKVNGITADYDVDQTYWAFLVNGEMAPAGVDTTKIEAGVTYTFKVSK